MKKYCFLLISAIMILSSCEEKDDAIVVETLPPVDFSLAVDISTKTLCEYFWNDNRQYFNSATNTDNWENNYWPQAHALDVLTDAYLRTGDNTYLYYFNNWLDGVRRANGGRWTNPYIDDMQWIALAAFRAYKATGKDAFLDLCWQVWEGDDRWPPSDLAGRAGIRNAWTEGAKNGYGGFFWNAANEWRLSKNACSNAPAAIFTAWLYNEFNTEEYREWALKIYEWQKDYLFNPITGAVGDALDASDMSVTWSSNFTYNQGTFLGAALELYKITGERSYLSDACKAADFTMNSLSNTTDQLLRNEGSGDGALFKGIFVRYFVKLIMQNDLNERDRSRYIRFLKHNGETLWREGLSPDFLIGPYWKEKPQLHTGLNEQLSGCMLFEALAMLQEKGYFE
ncbi:glycoside hydrolase family 76 protein [Gaoshiqia sp. Z1-71]|uniref:glycoside hydrolase family 76 protein n=1 Tax=Gaoshiqia hydrogeniformans TaxID=3290090 RepID=UPI003BF8297F